MKKNSKGKSGVALWSTWRTVLSTLLSIAVLGSPLALAKDTTAGISGTSEEALPANLFIELAKKVVPSVVNISTLTMAKSTDMPEGGDDPFRKFFEDFFGGNGMGPGLPFEGRRDRKGPQKRHREVPLPKSMALGTGFIIESSGLILTNNHVVSGADEIKVAFTEDPTEKPTDGRVVGRDPDLDIALIQVKTKTKLTPIVLGDSDAIQVGEYVAAVGNPFGQGHSVTHGIISAKGRLAPDFPLATYLQTDAPINPGNSGGPLVNLKGEVIGVNNAIDPRGHAIGFAIPINLVKKILPQLKNKGYVERGFLGVLIDNLTPELAAKIGVPKETTAPFITHVSPGSPAAKAGLMPYDVIMEFNGKTVKSMGELTNQVAGITVGKTVPMKVMRDGTISNIKVTLAKRPSGEEAKKKEVPEEEEEPADIESGMILRDITPELAQRLGLSRNVKGVLVAEVDPNGAAARAGMLPGDVIIEAEKKPVDTVKKFYAIVTGKKSYLLRVKRTLPNGKEAFTVILLDLRESPKE